MENLRKAIPESWKREQITKNKRTQSSGSFDVAAAPRKAGSIDLPTENLTQELWEQAYDNIEAQQPSLVRKYERITARMIGQGQTTDAPLSDNNSAKKNELWHKVLLMSLESFENNALPLPGMNIVGSAVKATPEAVLPWSALSLGLHKLFHSGRIWHRGLQLLSYIASKLEWYWYLPYNLRTASSSVSVWENSFWDKVKPLVHDLYEAVLISQMKTVLWIDGSRDIRTRLRSPVDIPDSHNDVLHAVKEAETSILNATDTAGLYSLLKAFIDDARPRERNIIRDISRQFQERQFAQMSDEDRQFMQYLRLTDFTDKWAHLDRCGTDIATGHRVWILDHRTFKRWLDKDTSKPVLWIEGDPGMGKTTLVCRIIEYLERRLLVFGPGTLAFFFCQVADVRLNNSTAVLRGLISQLIAQDSSLIAFFREDGVSGPNLFSGNESFYSLARVFFKMLENLELGTAYLVIDALDECCANVTDLVDIVTQTSSSYPGIHWLISSRPSSTTEAQLSSSPAIEKLSLATDGSLGHDFDLYIDGKISQMMQIEGDVAIQESIRKYLQKNGNGTFVWIDLTTNHLRSLSKDGMTQFMQSQANIKPKSRDHTLTSLYDLMVEDMKRNYPEDAELCVDILATVTCAKQALSIPELQVLIQVDGKRPDMATLKRALSVCESFSLLFTRGLRVSGFHYCCRHYAIEKIVPRRARSIELDLYSQSLQALLECLRRDMYNTGDIGISFTHARPAGTSRLYPIRYSCIHWIDHLCLFLNSEAGHGEAAMQAIQSAVFFFESRLLWWLESLCLLNNLAEGLATIQLLLETLQSRVASTQVISFIREVEQFIRTSGPIIQKFPLQAYGAALVFCHEESVIKHLYSAGTDVAPLHLERIQGIRDTWDGTVQILDHHTDAVRALSFSPDGSFLASASDDGSIRLWHASTGLEAQRLLGHEGAIFAIAFSPDGTTLASGSKDQTVRVWDVESGSQVAVFQGHQNTIKDVAFSPDGETLASVSLDQTIRYWNTVTTTSTPTFRSFGCSINAMAISNSGQEMALALEDKTVRLCRAATGEPRGGPLTHTSAVLAVALSPDGTILASAGQDAAIFLWNASSASERCKLKGHAGAILSVAFSPCSNRLLSASSDETIRLWDVNTESHVWVFEGHRGWVNAITFQPGRNSTLFASASRDKTVRLWDIGVTRQRSGSSTDTQTVIKKMHRSSVRSVTIAPGGRVVASTSSDAEVLIWDVAEGKYSASLKGHGGIIRALAFSPDGEVVATGSSDKTVRLWDTSTGAEIRTLDGHRRWINAVAYSPDGTFLASASNDKTVRLWKADGEYWCSFDNHDDWVTAVTVSEGSNMLASASINRTVLIWKPDVEAVKPPTCIKRITVRQAPMVLSFTDDLQRIVVDSHSFPLDSHNCGTSCGKEHNQEQSNWRTLIRDDWIVRDGKKVLWIPSHYRWTCYAVYKGLFVLGHKSGEVAYMYFKSTAGK